MQTLPPAIVTPFLIGVLGLLACAESGDPAETPAVTTRDAATGALQLPPALSWAQVEAGQMPDLRIGAAALDGEILGSAMLQMRQSFPAWGPATLAWHLLDGGLAIAALLHAADPEASEAARAQAAAAAARLRTGADFYALLHELGESKPPILVQPSPFGLGAATAAAVAPLEAGDWAGPIRTRDGWEVVLLEERAPGVRSRAGVLVRRLVYPIADEAAQARARQDWARLPLHGDLALTRALPRAQVRGRTTPSLSAPR